MKKRNVGILVSLVILVGMYILMVTRSAPTPNTYAKAKTTAITVSCLTEDPALTISGDEREAVELAAVSYLVDVPAGTEVDVKLATYADNKVTGSDHYPAKYGTYNFTMIKQGDDWFVTDFDACK